MNIHFLFKYIISTYVSTLHNRKLKNALFTYSFCKCITYYQQTKVCYLNQCYLYDNYNLRKRQQYRWYSANTKMSTIISSTKHFVVLLRYIKRNG